MTEVQFDELVERARAGEEIVITVNGKPHVLAVANGQMSPALLLQISNEHQRAEGERLREEARQLERERDNLERWQTELEEEEKRLGKFLDGGFTDT